MLTPQTLQKLPDEMVDLINEVQTDIIKSIAKKLVKADYLTPSAEWQLYKASQLRMSTSEVTAVLAAYTGKSKRQISKLYTDACKQAVNNDAKIYRAYGKDCSAALRSVALSNTIKAGIKNANGMTSNLTKSMVQSSSATVTHLMDKAYVKVASGAFTPQEAIYDAVSELASQGIQTVTYASGHTDRADVAVRRAVMTGISQTCGQLQLDFAKEMDCDLVEVTSHMGARPSHAEWQGKVYSISGKSKKYPMLSAATGYGTGDGLKGWNCRHDFFPFFEGVSERANLPVDISENNEQYALEQKQRAMERSVRTTKRRLAAFDGAISETDDEILKRKLQNSFERHSAILKEKEKRLSDYVSANGLYSQSDRVRVVGFNKSVAQKAVQGNKRYIAKKSIDKSSKSSIMKMGKVKSKFPYIQKAPDFSKYALPDNVDKAVLLERKESLKRAKNILINELGLSERDIDLSGLETGEVLEPFVKQLSKIKKATGLKLPKLIAKEIIDSDVKCIAAYKPMENQLYISSKFFNSKDALIDTLREWANNGIIPKQCRSISYIAEHEAAHIRIPEKLFKDKEFLKIHKQFLRSKACNANDIKDAEFIADCLATYRMNPNVSDENILSVIDLLSKEGIK